jgi:PTH1 family peptidyl-tRNA hydrolase
VLAVHDDLDLPLGRLRFAAGGGAGGHNGVDSLIEHLGGKDFSRLKIGIGRPANAAQPVVDYVLQKIPKSDEPVVVRVIDAAAEALEIYLDEGLTRAMERYNGMTF